MDYGPFFCLSCCFIYKNLTTEKEQEKATLEASKEEKRQAKEAAEGPEKEALDFYKQLEEEERIKKVLEFVIGLKLLRFFLSKFFH